MEDFELRAKLNALTSEHRELDAAIGGLIASDSADQVEIARLKKRKLRLKDEMTMLHDRLVPDIIA